MASFSNFATLSYSGGRIDSNTVTGELQETLAATKAAVQIGYTPGSTVTFVLSLVNSGAAPISGLTITDNLGGYAFNDETLYPLAYRENTIRYYVNGALQAAPAVTAGAPMVISGINVPAGGNALLVYETSVTDLAPMGAEASITNQATIAGGGLSAPLTAEATINMQARAELRISKGLCPMTVTENGQLTYTFVIENTGSVPAGATDSVILSDTFAPILNAIAVTFNGAAWSEGTNYTYDATTGVFETVAGQITVPAATYTQNADGTWKMQPGAATLVITGTV